MHLLLVLVHWFGDGNGKQAGAYFATGSGMVIVEVRGGGVRGGG